MRRVALLLPLLLPVPAHAEGVHTSYLWHLDQPIYWPAPNASGLRYQTAWDSIQAKRAGKSVAGYGAPGKGNTLLYYCSIRTDFLDYTVDRNPYKQGKFLPGTHIPILHPDKISETMPDYVLILPWNFKDEIMKQISYIRNWGGKFVVPIPAVKVYS